MSRLALVVLGLTLITACTGKTGPMGPEGPPGPGAGSVVSSGALDEDGFAVVHLPAEVGLINRPPNVACYVTDDPVQGAFSIIGSDYVLDAEMTLQFLEGCFIGGHLDHVDVFVVSVPGWAFIVVATPAI